MKTTIQLALAALLIALAASCGDSPATPTATPAPTPVSTYTPMPAPTPSIAASLAPTPVPTATAASSPSPVPTKTPTPAPTETPTAVPTETAAPTPSPSPVPTETPAHTPTPVPTATAAPTPVVVAPEAVPTETPTPVPLPPLESPAHAVLSRSIEAMREVESHRYAIDMEVVTTSDDVITTLPISVEGIYRAPDRYSAVLNLNMGFFGSFEIPIIAIGGDVYIRDPNFNEWGRVGVGDDLSYLDPDFIAFLANPAASIPADGVGDLRNLRLVETKTAADGTPSVHVVSFALPDGGLEDAYPKLGEVDATIEIGAADSLMRRVDAFGNIARRKDAIILTNPGGLPPGGVSPERRVSFHSSAALRDFGGVSEPIEPPVLTAP